MKRALAALALVSWTAAAVHGAVSAGADPTPGETPNPAADDARRELYRSVSRLMSPEAKVRKKAARSLAGSADLSLVPALVDTVFFVPYQNRKQIFSVLQELTGVEHSGYYEWIEFVGRREDLTPGPLYPEWKSALLQKIDPEYRKVFYPGAPARIRLEEVVSGGVRLAGIPALMDPPTLAGAEARYLKPDERVFGVLVDGEARAYPHRIMSWHEMLNDTIAGRPVTLSFCTLCGSGILYDASTPSGGRRIFETSGLLYRSNKLMLDRSTYSLWSNLTGEPVFGRLANSPIQLEVLPATVTTWEDWLASHPDTRVLDLKALEASHGRKFGFRYLPGAADRARQGVAFPVWLKSDRFERDTEVYTLRLEGVAKAYSLAGLFERGVTQDEVGGRKIVLVAAEEARAVRAYDAGERSFRGTAEPWVLEDEQGGRWRAGELALEPTTAKQGGLERIAGHTAFWFGWFAFYPNTEVYTD